MSTRFWLGIEEEIVSVGKSAVVRSMSFVMFDVVIRNVSNGWLRDLRRVEKGMTLDDVRMV